MAAEKGHKVLVEYLIAKGANINSQDNNGVIIIVQLRVSLIHLSVFGLLKFNTLHADII